ncbi:MAG: hypothetical protein OXJ52_06430 [Oligoflexia bacterium]|nr:hypothetical protein [Oligoflexia bacterium]
MWKLALVSFCHVILIGCMNKNQETKHEFVKKNSTEPAQEVITVAHKVAYKTAEDTAKQIASNAINQALQNIQQKFSSLSQEQIQIIKELALEVATTTALETANQTAEDTAKLIASNAANQAITDMQQQFSNFSELQIQIIKSATIEIANQIAENTAKHIASHTVNQAITDMQQQFSNLSQEQTQAIRELALETANQTAEDTAKLIASNAANQAIENMQQQFSNLSQEQIQAIKSATLKAAETIALETANQTAEDTAKLIAANAANQAIENMQQQFSNLSQEQIQAIKSATLEVAETTALETANQTAKDTAEHIAANAANQAIADMQQQFSNLSQEQIQAIKSATLEVAATTAREVADHIVEDLVKQTTFAVTDRAIEEMQSKHSALLKAGLQTIISAAIESVTASVLKSMDNPAKKEAIDTATAVAVTAAKEIAFVNEDQTPGYLKRQFFNLSFEQCDWKNKDYTTRLVQDHSFFPLSDPLKNMLESWDQFKTSKETEKAREKNCNSSPCAPNTENDKIDEEFAYLSPLYDDFILSFFQESIRDTYFSENDVPLECFFASAIRGANIYNSSKSFYYCEKDSSRPGNMSVTDDHENTRKILPRRACLNKDYMYLTARAFNKTADCFGFDKSEKEDIFKLFNHESSFLHNIKSHTGAKCYGQLTTVAIKEINKQIYFSDTSSSFPHSYIFNEVIEECPGLQNAVLNPKIYESVEQAGKKSMRKFHTIISKLPISCKITQNPYSCLFYALYHFKINSAEIEAQLRGPTSSFGKQNNIPQEFKDKFLLPIHLNTMLGVTNATGKDMVFWDDSEFWHALKNRSPDSLNNIRQLPLFENEEEVKKIFSLWTYNGGISTTKYMRDFIKQLKRSIAAPCPLNSQTKTCQYRFAVQNGQGLATEDVKKEFQTYIQRNHQKISGKRKKEVIHFVSNVEKNLDYLYNKNGLFRIHLKNLVPELESHEIENFQDHLKEVCPKP